MTHQEVIKKLITGRITHLDTLKDRFPPALASCESRIDELKFILELIEALGD